MTEDEEVQWINSLGFSCTKADLQASYTRFVPAPPSANLNVLWGTETDELRNWHRLYKRTGYAPFLQQASYWHDYLLNTYSWWQRGGSTVVEPSHVYLMGLVDWYLDNQDQPTLDAINRILDFIIQKVQGNPFYETRVTARCLQCLCYYLEKIGTRASEVRPKIQQFLDGIAGAKRVGGFVCMKFLTGTGFQVDGLPAGDDLRTLFPGNTAAGIVTGQNLFNLSGFYGCGVYQDCMLIHALRVAARVLGDPSLAGEALSIQQAWLPLVGPPFYDKTGSYNALVPYYIVATAPELSMFQYPAGASVPLYVTQFSCFCPDATLRTTLSQEALLRAYGEYSRIQPSELGGKPRFFPWQTWETGYFITQR